MKYIAGKHGRPLGRPKGLWFLFKMVLSNKHSVDKGGEFICFKCKGDMSVKKAFEFNQQNSQRK
jgi:hypothetical protein